VRAITLLAEAKGESWVNKAPIFNMIKHQDPTFDPKEFLRRDAEVRRGAVDQDSQG
jgi:hypothetical protein